MASNSGTPVTKFVRVSRAGARTRRAAPETARKPPVQPRLPWQALCHRRRGVSVRCDDCQDKPVGQSTHCVCCGRRLSAQEEQVVETAAASPTPGAGEWTVSPESDQCTSYGGRAEDRDLCSACRQAFQSVFDAKKSEPPVEQPTAFASEGAPVEAASVEAAPVEAAPIKTAPVEAVSAEPLPPPARPVIDIAPPPTITVKEPAPVREPTRSAPRPPRPPAPRERPVAPAPSAPRGRPLAIAGALIIIALAVCVPMGQPWLAGEEPSTVPEEQPEVLVEEPVAAPSRPVAPAPETTNQDDLAPDPPEVAPPPRRPSRKEPVAAPAAPAPAPEEPAAEPPAPEPVALAAPAPEPVAAPVGPFFELAKVNEGPQIASRIEPRVPDELRGPVNEIVILRVLVSQAGQPAIVTVLRRSKAGVVLDDAVVAAVKQWTFSPARKRGEPVSCWYHLGVPVMRAE